MENIYLTIFNDLGIEIEPELEEGAFSCLDINQEKMIFNVTINYPKVISVNNVALIRKKFNEYFCINGGFNKVNITFNYNDNYIDDDKLLNYYNYIINIFESNKPRYSILKNIHKGVNDNSVKFYVATEDEIETINPLLNEINKVFELYGLNNKCVAEISGFEIPVQKLIQDRLNIEDERIKNQQVQYDNIESNEPKPKIKKQPKMKNKINGKVSPIKDIPANETQLIEYEQQHEKAEFVILGTLISREIKDIVSKKTGAERKFKIFKGVINDGTDSISVSTFVKTEDPKNIEFYEKDLVPNSLVRAYGYAQYSKFDKDIVFQIMEIQIEGEAEKTKNIDLEPIKRVELHAHTKMSTQDGVMDVDKYVQKAKDFGFSSIAVTDHYNIHIWPDFENECNKANIKPIYGVEAAFINDKEYAIALTNEDIKLDEATYCVYDIETTGLSSNYDEIIEIGACKVKNGTIIDEFSYYVKPKCKISSFTTKLTSITEDDLRGADPIEVVLPKFKEFYDGCIMVGHNVTFDNSHIIAALKKQNLYTSLFPTIDTLQLFRILHGDKVKKFGLDTMVKFFDVTLLQHHRAVHDAKATTLCFIKMLTEIYEHKIYNYQDINSLINEEEAYKYIHPSHLTILVKDEIGKKNMYQIISDSHTVHFYKEPRVLKSYLDKHREGLLIGSACVNGEIFDIAHRLSYEELKEAMEYYDYIEVQPLELYNVIMEEQDPVKFKENIKTTVKKIIDCAKELGKIVVATGDVHNLNYVDKIYRDIYISAPLVGGGRHPLVSCKDVPSFYFRSTDEMLKEFSFLGNDLAYEIVVENTNKIANQISTFKLFPPKLFAPQDDFLADRGIPSVAEATKEMTYSRAHEIYGPNIHPYIKDRLDKELNTIIDHHFSTIYYIAYMLVKYSTDAGYIVGSRGSVGSSLVAHMMKITEVNGLPPHYVCPHCHFTAVKLSAKEKEKYPLDSNQEKLDEILQKYGTGFDLPEMNCPVCGCKMEQNGVDIPFETFLGFKGDKTPDIDLNFSGDFQAKAHEFTRTVFGVDRAFRAGTIGTIAEKKAFGYVKGYFERKGIVARPTEIARLASEIQGVKQSTGQHPGGIVVIPKEINYYDLIPIQYPADDVTSAWRTTHFDYHKFEHNLLKLDILGHDDPTMIRHLMDFVETYPDEFPFKKVSEIPLTDKGVFKLFSGLESLGLTPDQTYGQTIGTTGIPEFGTKLAKDMLKDILPTSVEALLKISGLSHGTDVWAGNAKDFMLGKKPGYPKIPFDELIGCRDDIMVYLISKNLPPADAFEIMEKVRKGKTVPKNFEKEMLEYNVPKWYIESCNLIKYMFPKAHATAYVIMALRIGWFKVYRPIFYYGAFFSRRADAFDVEAMVGGFEAIRAKLTELDAKKENHIASQKDEDTFDTLLLAIEMVSRGFKFKQMNIFESEAINFKVLDDRKTLLIPFGALDSLGASIANSVVDARCEHPFTSKADVMKRTKLNATQFEKMDQMGVFDGLPEDDQIVLF